MVIRKQALHLLPLHINGLGLHLSCRWFRLLGIVFAAVQTSQTEAVVVRDQIVKENTTPCPCIMQADQVTAERISSGLKMASFAHGYILSQAGRITLSSTSMYTSAAALRNQDTISTAALHSATAVVRLPRPLFSTTPISFAADGGDWTGT